jgi:hypothetical protein
MLFGMKPIALIASWVLTLLALVGLYTQHRRVSRLEARLAAPREGGAAQETADEVAGLAARLGRLERIVAFRPATPSAAPAANAAAAPAAPAAPTAPELHQLREDVDALLTGEATNTEQGKARLRALIAETQQQQWNERQTRRDERILQQLTDAAHLTNRQREDLGKIMEEERTQRRALLESARNGGGDFQELRPAMRALREKADQKARELLDANQFNQYNATRSSGRGQRDRTNPGDSPAAPR